MLAAGIINFTVVYFLIGMRNIATPGRNGNMAGLSHHKSKEDKKTSESKDNKNDKWTKMAEQTIDFIGKDNIKNIDNCITRVRLTVVDNSKYNDADAAKIGYTGVVKVGKQAYQMIIGAESEIIANEMRRLLAEGYGNKPVIKKEETKPKPVVKKEETKPKPTVKKEVSKPKPVVKKEAPKPKPKPVVKKEAPKPKPKPMVKKEAPKPVISAAEKAKRDAKRKALQEKANKVKVAGKISETELKKIKLTDLYGVGPKTEAYLKANDIDDILKLSKKNVETMSKKFINGLPAINSFTEKDKKQKLKTIIKEAEYMIKQITK